MKLSEVSVLKASAVRAPRPPKSVWTVDLKLSNRDSKAKWFLLSDPLENPPTSRTAPGVKLLEASAAKPAGEMIRLLRFSSTPNILAILVAPHSTVHLCDLKLQCWRAAGTDALEVHATAALLVSGRPVTEGWLKGHALETPPGDVQVVFGAGRQVINHLNPNFEAEPLSYEPEDITHCPLDVLPPWPPETPEEISSIIQLDLVGGPRR